jgi:ATF/CREB family transcription factor
MPTLISQPVPIELTVVSPTLYSPPPNTLILHDGFLSPVPQFGGFDPFDVSLGPVSRPASPFGPTLDSFFDLDAPPNDSYRLEYIPRSAKSPILQSGKLAAGPPATRPPIRPMPSKFELEPNPFEQSFSKGSTHSLDSTSDHNTPPTRGGDATSTKHNALPPLSSLTSPAAADPSQFPWLAGNSLRTGPLSPAMLAGPQPHHTNGHSGLRQAVGEPDHQAGGAFDSTTFRTGFTPGTGSGFTPGYSSLVGGNFASSMPMPSPNTAAFLNNFTNSTPQEDGEGDHGAPQHADQSHPPSAIPPHLHHHGLSHLQHETPQDTITPNTLSALTGVYNDMHRNSSSGPPPPSYYNPNMPPGPQHHHSHCPIHPGAPHVDYAQQSANAASQAANGLFLLSQAHHELSKREESEPISAIPRNSGPIPPQSATSNGKRVTSATQAKTPISAVSTASKRKSDPATLLGGKQPGKRGRKSANPIPTSGGAGGVSTINMAMAMGGGRGDSPLVKGEQSTSPQFSEEDMEGIDIGGGEEETEEDKRKNFLERNRQGEWYNPLSTICL